MKRYFKQLIFAYLIIGFAFLIPSCIDPAYDFTKGIDPEIKVGGDTLGIPLGKLDTIFLGDILTAEDSEFFKLLGDGGYGINLSDSFLLEDLLKELNVDDLNLNVEIPSFQNELTFQSVDVSSFSIPQFTDNVEANLDLPQIQLGDIMPEAINHQDKVDVNFNEYSLDGINKVIPSKDYNRTQNGLFSDAFDALIDIPNVPIPLTDLPPIPLSIADVDISYSISVPTSVTEIELIKLVNGAKLEIELIMENVEEALEYGIFTPNITIDIQDNVFEFIQPYPALDNQIIIDSNQKLDGFSNYTSHKSIPITSLHNLPLADDGSVDFQSLISITGTMDIEGTIKANKLNAAKNINFIINISIKELETDYMIFEIKNVANNLSSSLEFNLQKDNINEEIQSINSLDFGTPNSPNESYINVKVLPKKLPEISNAVYRIDTLDIIFPEEFTISSPGNSIIPLPNNTFACRLVNKQIDPVSGLDVKVFIEKIDMSGVDIDPIHRSLTYNINVEYDGKIDVSGKLSTKIFEGGSNSEFEADVSVTSHLQLEAVNVIGKDIKKEFSEISLTLSHEIDTGDENINHLGVVTVKSNSYLTIDVIKPTLPVPFYADNINLKFSDVYVFNDDRLTADNILIIDGEIPEQVKLEIKELRINTDLVNGKATITDVFKISGGYLFEGGHEVSSHDIEDLHSKKLLFVATVPEMEIESVSVGVNSIETVVKDTTDLDFELEDLPSQILALDSINFASNAHLLLDVTVENLPDLGDSPILVNMKIKIPEVLRFGSGVLNNNRELIINKELIDGKLTHSIPVKGLKFDGSDLNGKLLIDETIIFDCKISIANPTINSSDLNNRNIKTNLDITLNNLNFEKIYGKFHIDTDIVTDIPSLSFDDLPNFMKDGNMMLDIVNPILAMRTESNLGFPFGADLKLTKFIGGKEQTSDIIRLPFNMEKSENPNQITTNNVWYAPTEEGMSSEYEFVETPLNKLLMPLPDSVKIDFQPVINTNVQHVIDLNADYNVKVKYDLTVPFKFGKDLLIVYQDTIKDLNLNLEDIGEINTGELELIAKITNSIPLHLGLSMIILDEKDNILSTTEQQIVKAGNKDGTGNTSNIKVKLAESFAEVKNMNKIVLEFKANSDATVAGTPIKPENFIEAELTAKITGGISIKLPLSKEN